MSDKNLMSAISGLADAKPLHGASEKKKPKVINLGKGGSFNVKPSQSKAQHPHRNLGQYLHPSKSTNKGK